MMEAHIGVCFLLSRFRRVFLVDVGLRLIHVIKLHRGITCSL